MLAIGVGSANARPTADVQPSTSTTEVTLVGLAAENAELQRLLVESNHSVVIHRASSLSVDDVLAESRPPLHLRIWVVVSTPRFARLYFVAPNNERHLVREVTLVAGLDESGRETLAQVIATSAEAFIQMRMSSTVAEIKAALGKEASASVDSESEAPAQSHPRPARDGSYVRLHGVVAPVEPPSPRAAKGAEVKAWQATMGVFYASALLDDWMPAHGPGASLGVAHTGPTSIWSLAVQAQYQWSSSVALDEMRLRLQTIGLGMVSNWEHGLVGGWRWGVQVAVILERTEFSLDTGAQADVASTPGIHYRPLLQPGLRLGYRIGRLQPTLVTGAQIALVKTHYDIDATRLFTPSTVSPRLGLEVKY